LSATIRPGTAAPFTRSFIVEPAATVPGPPPASMSAAGGAAAPAGVTPSAASPRPTALALARPARFSTAVVLEPSFVSPLIDQLAARPDAAGVREALSGAKAGPWPIDSAKGPFADSPLAAQFVAGLGHLQRGDLEAAANAFRAALRSAPDFGPALTYLGACYAAGDKDREAAGAWQMALLRDRTSPALQRLAIEAWLRADRPSAAAVLITQARERWPDDPAFARLQAQAAIADGRVRDGVELAAALKEPDGQTLLTALAALYDAGRRHAPVWDAARDLETMRRLRDAYAAIGGESLALVDTWVAEMTKEGPRAPER
jgi:tetratricopeptide (TPR) repeat protein